MMPSLIFGMSIVNETSPHLKALLGDDCVVVVVVVTFSDCSDLQQTPIFLVLGSRQIVGKYLPLTTASQSRSLEHCPGSPSLVTQSPAMELDTEHSSRESRSSILTDGWHCDNYTNPPFHLGVLYFSKMFRSIKYLCSALWIGILHDIFKMVVFYV